MEERRLVERTVLGLGVLSGHLVVRIVCTCVAVVGMTIPFSPGAFIKAPGSVARHRGVTSYTTQGLTQDDAEDQPLQKKDCRTHAQRRGLAYALSVILQIRSYRGWYPCLTTCLNHHGEGTSHTCTRLWLSLFNSLAWSRTC